MIDGLVGGRLYGVPVARVSKNDNRFATAKLRTVTTAGDSLFVNVIAFAQPAVEALLALSDGDSIAVSGELTPKVWTDKSGESRAGLDVVAHVVLTAYHVTRKRQAVKGEAA